MRHLDRAPSHSGGCVKGIVRTVPADDGMLEEGCQHAVSLRRAEAALDAGRAQHDVVKPGAPPPNACPEVRRRPEHGGRKRHPALVRGAVALAEREAGELPYGHEEE